jgi:phosphate:Na+ symporter
MIKNIFLLFIISILFYGFSMNEDFKTISAGVAIFLFGMLSLEKGFQSFSGGILEKILERSTNKLYKSLSFGIISTTIMQSSSLVSILSISFLSAGLISLGAGIGIIFGSNIGTTTGAWLVAGFGLKVNIASYAMPMLVVGILLIFQNSKKLKGFGYVLSGLGFLFLGIHYMKEGFEAFKSTIDLSEFAVTGLKGLFIFTGIGIFTTVVMQSSHATLVLIITALSVGQISYENALALAIGANIGTTITAMLGAIGASIEGKRLAFAHLIFNLVTAFIAILLIKQLMVSVDTLAVYFGIGLEDYTLKLALFHTIFNVIGVLIMLPFISLLVKFLEKYIVAKSEITKAISQETSFYLHPSVLAFPSASIASLIKESKHLYENTFDILAKGLNVLPQNISSSMDIAEVMQNPYAKSDINIEGLYQKKIKGIYGEILDFASQAQENMSIEEIAMSYKIKIANRELVEAIKDSKHLQKNLRKYTKSDNEHIKVQYDKIKTDLVEILRNINSIATTEEEDVIIVMLSKSKLHSKKYDILANGALDKLIREGLISNEMATSLMNDSMYAYHISQNLIKMAEILFVDMAKIDKEMLMNEKEIETFIVNENDKGKENGIK